MRKGKLFFQISRVFYLPIYYKGIKKQDYTVYQYNPVYPFSSLPSVSLFENESLGTQYKRW